MGGLKRSRQPSLDWYWSRQGKKSKYPKRPVRFKKRYKAGYKGMRKKPTSRRKFYRTLGKRGYRSLGQSKDVYNPLNEQTCNLTINRQKGFNKQSLNKSDVSQQLQMVNTDTFQVTSGVGKQGSVMSYSMDNAEYNSTASDTNAEIPNMWNIISQQELSHQQAGMLTNLELRNQKIYLKSHTRRQTMVNTTTAPITVAVRFFRPMKDMNQDVLDCWDQVILDEANNDNTSGTISGFAPYNTLATKSLIGNMPEVYSNFMKSWRLIHRRVVTLQPGATYTVNCTTKYNQFCGWTDFYPPHRQGDLATVTLPSNNWDAEGRKYLSRFCIASMITIHGARASTIPSTEGIAGNIMTYAQGQLDVYNQTTTKFYACNYKRTRIYLRNLISTTPADTDLRVVDPDDDNGVEGIQKT